MQLILLMLMMGLLLFIGLFAGVSVLVGRVNKVKDLFREPEVEKSRKTVPHTSSGSVSSVYSSPSGKSFPGLPRKCPGRSRNSGKPVSGEKMAR